MSQVTLSSRNFPIIFRNFSEEYWIFFRPYTNKFQFLDLPLKEHARLKKRDVKDISVTYKKCDIFKKVAALSCDCSQKGNVFNDHNN